MDGILRCTNPPPRNNISMAYMKSSVRHDSCTIYICTRARLFSCQSLQRKINWPGIARGILSVNKETNKSWASIAVRHKHRTFIAPTMHAYALALIVEFVHINLGRGAGLVLLCLSLASHHVEPAERQCHPQFNWLASFWFGANFNYQVFPLIEINWSHEFQGKPVRCASAKIEVDWLIFLLTWNRDSTTTLDPDKVDPSPSLPLVS